MAVHQAVKALVGNTFSVPAQAGDFGVELEIEGLNLPTTVIGFNVKAEPSLRGAAGRVLQSGEGHRFDTPLEYVTKGAMTYDTLRTRLRGLNKVLTTPPVTVNLTTRASTHIHLNMQKQSFQTCFGFIILFTIVEPLLLRICGQHRNGNLFCLPNLETGDASSHFSRLSHEIIAYGTTSAWRSRGKYAALNTDPLNKFGSFETRCFPNTIDPDEILTWCKWLLNLRDMAAGCADDTFQSMVEGAYWGPETFAQSVFTDYPALSRAGGPNNISELIQTGAENAYELYRVFLPVLDYKDRPKKRKSSPMDAPAGGFFVPDAWSTEYSVPTPEEEQEEGF